MCKFAQYYHGLCGHMATGPFIYETCNTQCGFSGASAAYTRVEMQAPNHRMYRNVDITQIVLMSACRYCDRTAQHSDPYRPQAIILNLDQLLLHQQLQWQIQPLEAREIGMASEVHWDRPSTRQPESPPVSPTANRAPFSFDGSARTSISVAEASQTGSETASQSQQPQPTTAREPDSPRPQSLPYMNGLNLTPSPLRPNRQPQTVHLRRRGTLRATNAPQSLVPAPLNLSSSPRTDENPNRQSTDTNTKEATTTSNEAQEGKNSNSSTPIPEQSPRPASPLMTEPPSSPEINHEDPSLIPSPLSLTSNRSTRNTTSSSPIITDPEVDPTLIPLPLSIPQSRNTSTSTPNHPGESPSSPGQWWWTRFETWSQSHLPLLISIYILLLLIFYSLFLPPFNNHWSVYCSETLGRCTWLNR